MQLDIVAFLEPHGGMHPVIDAAGHVFLMVLVTDAQHVHATVSDSNSPLYVTTATMKKRRPKIPKAHLGRANGVPNLLVEKRGPVFVNMTVPLTGYHNHVGRSYRRSSQPGNVISGVLMVGGLYNVLWGKSIDYHARERWREGRCL
ncbi:hypothetical protein ACP4OV_012363 [Aristida adscensionis]